MITRIDIDNLGPIEALRGWTPGAGLNLIVGENASGKTLILEALYATIRAREQWRRGNDVRTYKQVLDEKLFWTFQVDPLGEIVRKGQPGSVSCRLTEREGGVEIVSGFELTRRAARASGAILEPDGPRAGTSIFIPAKEVLSLVGVIKDSRAQQKFGFGDPTYDLVLALESEPSRGTPPFGDARKHLEKLVGGRIQHDAAGWTFHEGSKVYPVALTAEGHKKIAILDRLIVNRALSPESILFVDEPESFLHPEALYEFLVILAKVSEYGVQTFIATHSLTVLNTLRLYAQSRSRSVPLVELNRGGLATFADLRDEMPENRVVDASIRLYEREMAGQFADG